MIKGKRVFLEDLVEEDIDSKPYPKYASYHKDMLMSGPFTVISAGKKRIAVRIEGGGVDFHFTADVGLVPYHGTHWNETNRTYEMLSEPPAPQ